MHKKSAQSKNAQNDKGPFSISTFQNLFKSLSGHLLIAIKPFQKCQGINFNSILDILLTRFHPYLFKGYNLGKGHNNLGKGHNPDKKKIRVRYLFMRNPYMKFQNPSMHNSKLIVQN